LRKKSMNDKERDDLLAACDYLETSFGDIRERIDKAPSFEAMLSGEVEVEKDDNSVSVSEYAEMEPLYSNLSRKIGRGFLPSLPDLISSKQECDDLIEGVAKARAHLVVKALPTTQVAPASGVDDEQTRTAKVDAAPPAPEPKAAAVASAMEPTATVTKQPPATQTKPSPREMQDSLVRYLEKISQELRDGKTIQDYEPGFANTYSYFTGGMTCPPTNILTLKMAGIMLANVKKVKYPADKPASAAASNTSAATNKGEPETPKSRVEVSVSYRFYRTGEFPSYIPLFLGDLLASEQFRIMERTAQLVLVHMIYMCNMLMATVRKETEGFTYTYSHCPLDLAEQSFRDCMDDLVERGWFRRIKPKGSKAFLYFPCTEWQTKPLMAEEIQELIEKERKKSGRVSKKTNRMAGEDGQG
jgi:hypothetical protein